MRVYETYPGEDQARSPNRWNQPQFCAPETKGKLQISYLQRILTVWKSVGGVVLAAPPGSHWCGVERGAREERRGCSAAA